MDEPESGRTRRRAGRKGDGKPAEPKVNVNLSMSAEAARRLAVHAVGEGKDRGVIVEELINTNLRRYVLQDRGGAPAVNSDGPADPPVEGVPDAQSLTSSEDTSEAQEPGQGRGRGGKRKPAA